MSSDDDVTRFGAACVAVYNAIRRNRGRADPFNGGETVIESQAALLEPLVERGPLPVGALAECVGLAQPTVTRSLKSLERQGLVTRARPANDDRTVLVEITARGRKTLTNTRARLRALQAAALNHFPQEERENAIRTLTRIAEAIKETSPR